MSNKPIPLEIKPDWPEVSKRWEAFWKGEVPKDRILMSITVPAKENPYPRPADPENFEEYHTNLDLFISRVLHKVYSSEYLGDAFPAANNSITACFLAALLDADLHFMENGVVWCHPTVKNWEDIDDIKINWNSKWYKYTLEQFELMAEHKDKFITQMPDFHGISDALAAIRGSAELALDLIDDPDKVVWAAKKILKAWKEAYDAFYSVISKFQKGSSMFLKMWHPGRLEVIQEDFIEMISQAQYEEFFMDLDDEFAKHVDVTIFHLHPTMYRYQRTAAKMKNLTGTQFNLPFDDEKKYEPIAKHLETYRIMHAAGKKTWYRMINEEDLKNAILNGDPRHLLIVGHAPNRETAERYLYKACEWTEQRKKELGL